MTVTVSEDRPAAAGPERGGGRPPWWRRALNAYLYGNQFVVIVLAFVVALVVGAILIAVADNATRTSMGYFFQAPGDTFSNGWKAISAGYSALFRGSILNTNSLYSNGGVPILDPISNTLVNAAPLILGGLAVAVAFRAGLFNIGVQGQLIMGAIFAGYVGFKWHLPTGLHVILAILAGILGGAIWGGIVGVLKAKTGAHEVITTIMLNYVAYYFLGYLLTVNGFRAPNQTEATTSPIRPTARLPHLFNNLHFGIILALAGGVACWWLLSRSTLGFRLKMIGANPAAARTAGMKVERGYIIVMIIAGALAGLLFGAFRAGGVTMGAQTSTPPDVVPVIETVIVLFIAAPALIREIFRLRAARGGSGAAVQAKGWNG